MASNKKSVLLYCDLIHTVEGLKDVEAGRLFKHYLRYINDMNPTEPDKLTKIVFEPIKQNLKRDLKKWEKKSERNREIALAAWEKRTHTNAYERMQMDTKNTDTVTDTDNDTVTDTDMRVKEHTLFPGLKISNETYFKDLPNSSELVRIAQDLKLTPDQVKSRIEDFRPNAEMEYPSFSKFAYHFKSWIRKNPKQSTAVGRSSRALE